MIDRVVYGNLNKPLAIKNLSRKAGKERMMDIKEAIRSGLKELILPELDSIKNENREIKTILAAVNKRLDDINLHLADQSRRIDETNKRIDETRDYLLVRMDEINKRLDRLYEVIVRREEHEKLELRMMRLEEEISHIKEKITA